MCPHERAAAMSRPVPTRGHDQSKGTQAANRGSNQGPTCGRGSDRLPTACAAPRAPAYRLAQRAWAFWGRTSSLMPSTAGSATTPPGHAGRLGTTRGRLGTTLHVSAVTRRRPQGRTIVAEPQADLGNVWNRAIADLSGSPRSTGRSGGPALSSQQRAFLRLTRPLGLIDGTA